MDITITEVDRQGPEFRFADVHAAKLLQLEEVFSDITARGSNNDRVKVKGYAAIVLTTHTEADGTLVQEAWMIVRPPEGALGVFRIEGYDEQEDEPQLTELASPDADTCNALTRIINQCNSQL